MNLLTLQCSAVTQRELAWPSARARVRTCVCVCVCVCVCERERERERERDTGIRLPGMPPRDIPIPLWTKEPPVRGWPLPLLRSSRKTGQGHPEKLLVELWNPQHFPSGGPSFYFLKAQGVQGGRGKEEGSWLGQPLGDKPCSSVGGTSSQAEVSWAAPVCQPQCRQEIGHCPGECGISRPPGARAGHQRATAGGELRPVQRCLSAVWGSPLVYGSTGFVLKITPVFKNWDMLHIP